MSHLQTINISVETLHDLAKFSEWLVQTEGTFRRQLKRWHELSDPDEQVDVIFMEEPEFLEVLDGLKHTAEYLQRLALLVGETGGDA